MSKKPASTENTNPPEEIPGFDTAPGSVDEDGYSADIELHISEDFDTEAEYKPTPLIPAGKYRANVTKVVFNPEDQTINWTITFSDNEGRVMIDNETPVDGNTLGYRNWLPKPGDENEMTTSGRQTKRQAKINMLQDFAKEMKINMSTPKIILTALANQEWLGHAVVAQVGFRTWEGRTFNDIKRMSGA